MSKKQWRSRLIAWFWPWGANRQLELALAELKEAAREAAERASRLLTELTEAETRVAEARADALSAVYLGSQAPTLVAAWTGLEVVEATVTPSGSTIFITLSEEVTVTVPVGKRLIYVSSANDSAEPIPIPWLDLDSVEEAVRAAVAQVRRPVDHEVVAEAAAAA